MTQVQRENDDFRCKLEPDSTLLHSFRASSFFEACRLNNEWHGLEPWKPEPGWAERPFTDEEQREQDAYLRERSVRFPNKADTATRPNPR
jgi:hypothetical protein